MSDGARLDVRLCDGPVSIQPWLDAPPGGGECIFLGRTRAEAHPLYGGLDRLSYEAYRPMAERILRDLASQAVERFGCRAVRIHHAVGEVPVGYASVLIQVMTDHRAEAFEACRFLIDAVKARAPIWKREVWASGMTWSPGAAVPTAEVGR